MVNLKAFLTSCGVTAKAIDMHIKRPNKAFSVMRPMGYSGHVSYGITIFVGKIKRIVNTVILCTKYLGVIF